MKVQLNWKESSYSKLPELHIAASEIVSDETFEQMQAHPLWDHDVIQKHIQDMRSVAGGEYCLLIAPENGTDGLLVRSEGSSCARYSAYIPGGRLMTLVTPELERTLRKCETAAKEAVRRECMQTLTGKWTCSLAELDAAFGAGPVSYTHLDVYKRQAVFIEMIANDPEHLRMLQSEVEAELNCCKISADHLLLRQKLGFQSVMPSGWNAFGTQYERVPVSYTHLDVYKRQVRIQSGRR